jgi:ribosomal protein S18
LKRILGFLAAVVAVVVVAVPATASAAPVAIAPAGATSTDRSVGTSEIVVLGLFNLAALVILVGAVTARRRIGASPLQALTAEDQREVGRALRRGQATDLRLAPVAVATGRHLARSGRWLWITSLPLALAAPISSVINGKYVLLSLTAFMPVVILWIHHYGFYLPAAARSVVANQALLVDYAPTPNISGTLSRTD